MKTSRSYALGLVRLGWKVVTHNRSWIWLLVLATTAGNAQVGRPNMRNEPVAPRPPTAQVARAQSSEVFKAAVEILDEQDETVNPSTARLTPIPNTQAGLEIRFDVTRKNSKELGEFKQLVYVERPGKPAFVYFDESTGRAPAQPRANNANARICLASWSSWTQIDTECKDRWICLQKKQGLFALQRREKRCAKDSKIEYRWKAQNCGC